MREDEVFVLDSIWALHKGVEAIAILSVRQCPCGREELLALLPQFEFEIIECGHDEVIGKKSVGN